MGMWLADTIIVGRLGAEAIGAVSIGGGIFFAFAIFGIGMLLGLDYAVATAFGAARISPTRHRALVDGVWLALGLSVALTIGPSPLHSVPRCRTAINRPCSRTGIPVSLCVHLEPGATAPLHRAFAATCRRWASCGR